jgi:uncharacterized protein with WD repeat
VTAHLQDATAAAIDTAKQKRALLKRLRQIEELDARRARGDALKEAQLAKIARRSHIEAALASLAGDSDSDDV